MANLFHHVVPQRGSHRGWVECEPAQAQRFAVLSVRKLRSRGKDMAVTRCVGSHKTAAEAALDASQRNAGHKPHPRDVPALGQRFPKRNVPVIAKGIGRDVLP